MGYLLVVTLIQAFSFSLIGEYLAGHVDSYFAVLVRVVLAGLIFIPLTRWRTVEPAFMRGISDPLFSMMPFLVTAIVLVITSIRLRPERMQPKGCGVNYDREER